MSSLTEPQPSKSTYHNILSQFQGDWVERLNVEQMFIFIDGILPFEACLYYQVLPLFIEGSRLSLGMVSPEDSSALDYVRRIISYMNYSLMPRPISSEALQSVLSAYLHQAGAQQEPLKNLSRSRPNRGSARARAEQRVDRNAQQTLIVDSPEDLNLEGGRDEHSESAPPPHIPPPHIPFAPVSPLPEPLQDQELSPHPELPQYINTDAESLVADLPVEAEVEALPAEAEAPISPEKSLWQDRIPAATPASPQPAIANAPPIVPPSLIAPLPELEIQANHLSSPIEVLATLPPGELLKELLARVLLGGIGRLYFERQPQYGRVLWSQNGVLQSVLDKLEPSTFQGIINELKRMTRLSLIRVQTSRQVEIERLYQNTRLMLRFRVMPSVNGEEEATLQVLRGAALKFYQQQQLASLERDAISIAKQLQLKVNEIRDRARSEPGLSRSKLDALPALNQMLRYIEGQLEDLQADEGH